ncbi:hypothetical protein [Sphingomonas cynarae]
MTLPSVAPDPRYLAGPEDRPTFTADADPSPVFAIRFNGRLGIRVTG